jgi:hypothetical protein
MRVSGLRFMAGAAAGLAVAVGALLALAPPAQQTRTPDPAGAVAAPSSPSAENEPRAASAGDAPPANGAQRAADVATATLPSAPAVTPVQPPPELKVEEAPPQEQAIAEPRPDPIEAAPSSATYEGPPALPDNVATPDTSDAPEPEAAEPTRETANTPPVDTTATQAAPPPQPAWRRYAAAAAASEGPRVAVALVGFGEDPAAVERFLALGAPVSVVVDPGDAALADRARAIGGEALTLGAAGRGAFVGVALTAGADAPDPELLTLDLREGAARPSADGGLTLRPDLALPDGASAERVFFTLREAERRALEAGGPVVVALGADEAAVTGLARWMAVSDVPPAPLTAAVAR